jgi:hypothetical protein
LALELLDFFAIPNWHIRGLPIPPAFDDELNSTLAALALLQLLDMSDFPIEPVEGTGAAVLN